MGNKLIGAENTNEDRKIIQTDQRIYKIQKGAGNSIGHKFSATEWKISISMYLYLYLFPET